MSVTQSDYKRLLQSVIEINDNAVINVLLMIYERQTDEEQITEQTIEENGEGFTGADAEILTSFSRQYLERGFLSPKQMTIARDKVKKYWCQVRDVLGDDLSKITSNPMDSEPEPGVDVNQLEVHYTDVSHSTADKKKQSNLHLWKEDN